jgi:hypothetical protein
MLAGFADPDPHAARSGLVGGVDPLRNDALGAKLARMGFVQQDARPRASSRAKARPFGPGMGDRADPRHQRRRGSRFERPTPRTVTSRQISAQPLALTSSATAAIAASTVPIHSAGERSTREMCHNDVAGRSLARFVTRWPRIVMRLAPNLGLRDEKEPGAWMNKVYYHALWS